MLRRRGRCTPGPGATAASGAGGVERRRGARACGSRTGAARRGARRLVVQWWSVNAHAGKGAGRRARRGQWRHADTPAARGAKEPLGFGGGGARGSFMRARGRAHTRLPRGVAKGVGLAASSLLRSCVGGAPRAAGPTWQCLTGAPRCGRGGRGARLPRGLLLTGNRTADGGPPPRPWERLRGGQAGALANGGARRGGCAHAGTAGGTRETQG
jgi:hypothetical protein